MVTSKEYRLFYPYSSVGDPMVPSLKMYTGAPVKVYGNDAPPASSSNFEPPQVSSGWAVYFDGMGWWSQRNIRLMTMEERKKLIHLNLDESFRKNVDRLSKGYTPQEMFTWASQENEARAFLAGKEATYLLQVLAAANNYTIEHLCHRIVLKADAYRKACSDALAHYQRAQNKVNAAKTVEELPVLTEKDFRWAVMSLKL